MMEDQPLLSNEQKSTSIVISKKPKCILLSLILVFFSALFIIGLMNSNVHHATKTDQTETEKVGWLQPSTKTNSNPNIIYIVVDDLGWADISTHGAEYDTPYIDNLIENESIFLKSHYVGLLCSPSRSQFLTGRYAFNMGFGALQPFDYQQISSIPHGMPLISNLLQKYGGYENYALGKWHVGYATQSSLPLERGFDYYYGFNVGGIFYYNKTKDGAIDWWENNEPKWDDIYEHSTIQLSNKLHEIVAKYDISGNESPFYIYAGIQAIHTPLQKSPTSRIVKQCSSIRDPSRNLVCQNVKEVDQLIGRLQTQLESSSSNLWDNTIIVFTTDNGGDKNVGSCNYPLRGYKGTFFDGAVKTLAFVSGGYFNDKFGTIRNSLFHGADWTPTLLSLANINIPITDDIEFDGIDLSDMILYGDDYNTRDELPLNVGTLNDYNNAIIFTYKNTLYKYILLNENEVEKGVKMWCYFNEDGVSSNYHPTDESDTDDNGEQITWIEFLFDLDNDANETYNFIEYYDNESHKSQKRIINAIEDAKIKLSKYRENALFNDQLECFSDVFSEGNPEYLDRSWQPFYSWNEYVKHFNRYCDKELESDDLKTLHITRYV